MREHLVSERFPKKEEKQEKVDNQEDCKKDQDRCRRNCNQLEE